jgi:hypothetical protein
VQLPGKPLFQSDGPDSFEVARTGAEGEAIESLENAVVATQLAGLIGLAGGFWGWGGRGLSRCRDGRGGKKATQKKG